jgi:hypothetical protein
MMKNSSRSLVVWAVCLAALFAVTGCAEDVGDIDRTQPNKVLKSDLEGEWYYQRTVVDMPGSDGFTFVGMMDNSGLSRIEWDVQEDYLYARRQTELIIGGDQKDEQEADPDEEYEGEVIASYRIKKHFDIQREYNSQTGEQSNVLVENSTDRPWFERDYIRVDWSQNLVTNYDMNFETKSVEPVPYFVQEDDGDGVPNSHAPVFDYGPRGEQDEDGPLNYFDITNKLFASAGTAYIPGYGTVPSCWLRGSEFEECGAGEYTIRNSFMKIDPDHEYVPMDYTGQKSSIFGYFDTTRYEYDNQEGIREQDKTRRINRFNLWKKWYDSEGNILPVEDRVLDPIVYHVNRDFPDDLKPVAIKVGEQWNRAFEKAVTAAGYNLSDGEDAFILCPNNPVEAGDPAQCGAEGTSPRLGDVRYSFMAYVPKFMEYGLLGFGPANKDPITGEIISGQAYVYHHNNTATYRTLEMVELLNETRDTDDFIDGVDLESWKERVNSGEGSTRTHDVTGNEPFLESMGDKWDGPRFEVTEQDVEIQKEIGFDAWLEPYLEQVYRQSSMNGEMSASDARLGNLKGTYIEDLLVNDEILMGMGHQPGEHVTEEMMDRASVARGGFAREAMRRARLHERYAAHNNMYLANMADDALMGLARELKGTPSDEAYEIIRESIYTAVLAHEVGHTLGLMHNFSGSEDVLNYFPEYWEIRDDGNVGPRITDPITEDEINAKIYDNAYSSIMDYAGRYTIDGKGVARYDEAAIMFGYAEKVEVYEDSHGIQDRVFRDWADRDGEVLSFTGFGPRSWHYTQWWDTMGEDLYSDDNRRIVDIDDMVVDEDTGLIDWTTAEIGGETYKRVPYIYCSHNRYNLGDNCLTRDYGADSYERMKNMLDDLDTWYILRNFPRGRTGIDSWSYVSSYYGRIYDRLKNWNDIYALYVELLPQFYPQSTVEGFFTDPETGWGGKTWAVKNAFNYLVQTVMTPKLGPHQKLTSVDGTTMYTDAQTAIDTEFDVTQARYYSTSWGDGDRECGYYWWECLHHLGFYLDKIMAIEALTDTRTNFVARATPEDIREWEIGYVNTFPEQYSIINRALMEQDFSTVGPYLNGNEIEFPDYTGDLDTASSEVVDPRATFTIQLYWQVLGQARLPNSYDRSFVDESRIWIEGTGREPNLADSEKVTFREPGTGYVFGASTEGNDGESAAAEMIRRANLLLSKSQYCDDAGNTALTADDCQQVDQTTKADATRELNSYIELLRVMNDLEPMLRVGNPYSP